MKSKLLILAILIWIGSFGQSVPDTETFSLQDVYNVVHSHAPSTTFDLNSCFTNAVSGYFDSDYTYYTANSMLRFRNYTVATTPIVVTSTIYEDFVTSGATDLLFTYLGGNVTYEGGSTVTDKGVCLSATNSNPTIGGSGVTTKSVGYGGIGTFSVNSIHEYTPGATLYGRAYATNSYGTSYGTVETIILCENDATTSIFFYRTNYQTSPHTCSDYANIVIGFTLQSTGTTVGSTVYAIQTGQPKYCDLLNGYYFDYGGTKLYHIVDGVIDSIVNCP